MSVLTYYNPENFNGVLILLREPHDEGKCNDAEGALDGNRIWFQNIIGENIKRSRQESKYRKRFYEMLTYCGECELEKVAFANIKLQGGGSSASIDYNFLTEENKRDNFQKIKEEIEKSNALKYVFTVWDIFDAIVSDTNTNENGIMYYGEKYKDTHFSTAKIDGITYYKILHPCRSPGIIGKPRYNHNHPSNGWFALRL